MFWAWRGAPGCDDSGITRSSFVGAGGLLCGLLLVLGISFVFPLCIGVFLLCWAACLGLLMEAWATFILLLDSNRGLNNHMQSSLLSSGT